MGNRRAEASLNKRVSHSESELDGLDSSGMQGINLQPAVKSDFVTFLGKGHGKGNIAISIPRLKQLSEHGIESENSQGLGIRSVSRRVS